MSCLCSMTRHVCVLWHIMSVSYDTSSLCSLTQSMSVFYDTCDVCVLWHMPFYLLRQMLVCVCFLWHMWPNFSTTCVFLSLRACLLFMTHTVCRYVCLLRHVSVFVCLPVFYDTCLFLYACLSSVSHVCMPVSLSSMTHVCLPVCVPWHTSVCLLACPSSMAHPWCVTADAEM